MGKIKNLLLNIKVWVWIKHLWVEMIKCKFKNTLVAV